MLSYRSWVLIATALFGVGILLGVLMPVTSAEFLADDLTALQELAAMLGPFQFSTAVFIFFKNVLALAVSFIFSPIFILVPVLALTMNGWILSFVSTLVIQEESWGFLLAGLLPHGVFELPAIIIGEAAALSFGAMTILLLVQHERRAVLISTAKQDTSHIFLSIALFFLIGIFHTAIILALLKEETRAFIIPNMKKNAKYLLIAVTLLLPAAVIETYITPLFLP